MNQKLLRKHSDCIPCQILLKTCEALGGKDGVSYCEIYLDKVKKGRMNTKQVIGALTAKFGKKLKKKATEITKETFKD